jgi:hypothetical protein
LHEFPVIAFAMATGRGGNVPLVRAGHPVRERRNAMKGLVTALLTALFAGLMTAAYAAGDLSKCEKLTGAAKDKCVAEESRK